MNDYFRDIPPEILMHIFSYLPAQTLACSAALVCRAFRDCTQCSELWSTVRYNYRFETVASFSSFLRKHTRVRKLELRVNFLLYKLNCPDYRIPVPSSLTKLIIRGDYMFQLKRLDNKYPNLKALKLICTWFDERLGEESSSSKETPMMAVLSQLSGLEKITVQRPVGFPMWNFLGTVRDTLKELVIREHPLQFVYLIKIAEACPRLEKFHFETEHPVSFIVQCLENLPLRDLAVYNPDVFCELICEPVHEFVEPRYLAFFKKMTDLARCEFAGAYDFNDTVLKHMADHCTKLRVVKFYELHQISYPGILSLVEKMQNLTELWVHKCCLMNAATRILEKECNARGIRFIFSNWRKKYQRRRFDFLKKIMAFGA